MMAYSIYIPRGFGLFEVGIGAGVTGQARTATQGRSPNNDKEVFRDAHIKCPINNRICAAVAPFRFGAKKMTVEDEPSALLIDFGSVSNTAMDDWAPTDKKLGRMLTPQNALRAFAEAGTARVISRVGWYSGWGVKTKGSRPRCS